MPLDPIVVQSLHPAPLDPLASIVYVALFATLAMATLHRPLAGAAALVAIQPFALYRDLFGTTITCPKVAIVAVLLALIARPNARVFLRERAPHAILLAGLALLAAIVLSFVPSAHHDATMRETLKQIQYLLVFGEVYICYRLDPSRRVVTAVLAAAAIAVALSALVQEILGAPSAFVIGGHPLPRIAGALEGPNQLGAYVEIVAPLLFATLALGEGRVARAALFFVLFADILTFSRGGLFGTLLALAVAAWYVGGRAMRAMVPTLGGIAAGGIVALGWGWVAHASTISRFWNFSEPSSAGGVGTRSVLWRAAITLWRRHPLLGVGAGNFELDLPQAGVTHIRTHANELYLQALAEGGIPLFGATVALIAAAIGTFARRARRSPVLVAAVAATVALAAHQLFDDVLFYPKVGATWWALLGWAAAELALEGRTTE